MQPLHTWQTGFQACQPHVSAVPTCLCERVPGHFSASAATLSSALAFLRFKDSPGPKWWGPWQMLHVWLIILTRLEGLSPAAIFLRDTVGFGVTCLQVNVWNPFTAHGFPLQIQKEWQNIKIMKQLLPTLQLLGLLWWCLMTFPSHPSENESLRCPIGMSRKSKSPLENSACTPLDTHSTSLQQAQSKSLILSSFGTHHGFNFRESFASNANCNEAVKRMRGIDFHRNHRHRGFIQFDRQQQMQYTECMNRQTQTIPKQPTSLAPSTPSSSSLPDLGTANFPSLCDFFWESSQMTTWQSLLHSARYSSCYYQ